MIIPYSQLTIHLDAVIENYKRLQQRAKSSICAAVLKANAYGLGAKEIGKSLFQAGCHEFFVAYFDEALALRKALPEAIIYLLNGPYEGQWQSLCVEHRIIPVLSTFQAIEQWNSFCKHNEKKLPAVLHINTGMYRLGLPLTEVETVREEMTHIEWCLVMSHLACAEQEDHLLNIQQLKSLKSLKSYFPKSRFSLANSSGLFLPSEFHLDLVRPGMGLYGLNPTSKKNPMKTCISLSARILQIQEVPSHTPIGYGCTYVSTSKQRVATLSIGYADGLSRLLSNQEGHVIINKQKAPLLGRISMDLATVDISHIENVKENDWALIIGPEDEAMTPEFIAHKTGLSEYEIILGLGDRFIKKYVSKNSFDNNGDKYLDLKIAKGNRL